MVSGETRYETGAPKEAVYTPPAPPAVQPTASAQSAAVPPAGTPERTSIEAKEWVQALRSSGEGGRPARPVTEESAEELAPGQLRLRDSVVEAAAEADAPVVTRTSAEASAVADRSREPITAGTEEIPRKFPSSWDMRNYFVYRLRPRITLTLNAT